MNRLNTIYYRFQSEKKKYSINFNTTEISIGDIKKEIVHRRNLEKVPEKIELIFYNENNEEIRDDNMKINPLQMLCIKRIPSYKTFSNFVEIVRDPSDISSSRFGDMNFHMQHKVQKNPVHSYDPIEKIIPKINFDILKKKFSCNICGNTEDKFFILSCCGETVCEKCKIRMENTNETCKACDEKPKIFMPNNPIGEFKDRIISIIQRKKAKAEEEAAEALVKMNAMNQQNLSALGQAPTQITNPGMIRGSSIDERLNEKLKNLHGVDGIGAAGYQQPNMPQSGQVGNYMTGKAYGNYDSSIPQQTIQSQQVQNTNPHQILFDNARFFIIKSTNRENVEISQKNSQWATTQSNQKKLNEAFQNNYVILVFSVNKSSCYQGYAIMTSYISDKVSNIWQNESSVKLGGPFSVHWLCQTDLPFVKVGNLSNPINNNESIRNSRDTQELPRDIGSYICNLCFEHEKGEAVYKIGKQQFIDEGAIQRLMDEVKKNKEKFLSLKQANMIKPQIMPQTQMQQTTPSTNTMNTSNPMPNVSMMPQQTMFPMQNPMFFPFGYQDPNMAMMKTFQFYQMAQNQNKAAMMVNPISNPDGNDDKKSIKSIDKSRDVSMDKSVSTIKSRKSKHN